jgi:hypothetical protein
MKEDKEKNECDEKLSDEMDLWTGLSYIITAKTVLQLILGLIMLFEKNKN